MCPNVILLRYRVVSVLARHSVLRDRHGKVDGSMWQLFVYVQVNSFVQNYSVCVCVCLFFLQWAMSCCQKDTCPPPTPPSWVFLLAAGLSNSAVSIVWAVDRVLLCRCYFREPCQIMLLLGPRLLANAAVKLKQIISKISRNVKCTWGQSLALLLLLFCYYMLLWP